MNLFYKRLALILLLGLALSELDQVVYFLSPVQSITPKTGLYLDKGYKTPITPVYYIYELTGMIYQAIGAMVLCLCALKLNYRFYLFSCVFLFFRSTQIAFYLINRNCDLLNNIFVYVIMSVMIVIWVKPFHKEAKIVRM